ncbi:MAG: hypothetical protein U9N35_03700 [Euryarchaeota archaeon]|nr:hypothetical protein [Euryarchaeota archaeon]
MKNKLLVLFFILLLFPKTQTDISYDDEIKVKTEVYKNGTLDSSLTEIYKGMFIEVDELYKLKIVDYDFDTGKIYLELYRGDKKESLYQWDCENNIYSISDELVCCPNCFNNTVLIYEDEYCDISVRFNCFDKDGVTEGGEEIKNCCPLENSTATTTVNTYAKLQVYFHKKYTKISEKTISELEEIGLLDNNEKGYQVSEDEIIVSDPYYMALKDDKLFVYETDSGARLSLNLYSSPPYKTNVTSYGGYKIGIVNKTIFSTLNPSDPLYTTVKNSEMYAGDHIESSIQTIETVDGTTGVCKLIVGEEIYTIKKGGDNVILRDDFGIIVTKFDVESKTVYLKFLKKVDEEEIGSLDFAEDYEITLNEKYSNFLVDIVSGSKLLKNRVGLRYEDLQGTRYKEMPFEKDAAETAVTYMGNLSVEGENPNAHDFTGGGWATPEVPNYRYAVPGEDTYGTCVRGDKITYTINYEYSALAPGDATNVTITDVLPNFDPANPDPDLIFVSATGSFTHIPATNTVTWNIGTLHPGDSGSVSVTVRVADGVSYGTEIPNHATIEYTEDTTTMTIDTSPVIFKVQAMDVVKEVSSASASPGDTITYAITYYNTTSLGRVYGAGDTPSTITVGNIQIEDAIPGNVSVDPASISDGGSIVGGIIRWSLSTLSPESSHSLTFQATVDSVVSLPVVSNDATITHYDLYGTDAWDPNGTMGVPETDSHNITSNTVQTIVSIPPSGAHSTLPCCRMILDKEAPSTATPGETITYTITYQNTGLCEEGNAHNVKIIDTLPEDTVYTSHTAPPGATFTQDGNLLIWEIPQVSTGETGTITVDASVNSGMDENAYHLRVYEYKKYAQVKEDWIGFGDILSYDEYSLILEETHKNWYDINEVQIHKSGKELDDLNMAVYQRCVYDEMVFEFLDNSGTGEKFKGLFRIYKRVVPNIRVSSEFERWDKTEETWSNMIYSNDKFYLSVSLKNTEETLNIGKGMARNIRYSFESELDCEDATWMYLNYCEQNAFDLYPEETGYIILELNAPYLDFEKEYETTVRITWEDDLGNAYGTEKTFTVNVIPSPQEKVLRVYEYLHGSNEIKVGETKKVEVFIRNLSKEELDVEFKDNIPQGLSLVGGSPEFEGTIEPETTIEIEYMLQGDEQGTYSFSGEAYYTDIYGRHKVVSNIIDIHVIGTEELTLTKSISKNYLKENEIIDISLMVRNNTEESITDMEVVDIVPEEFDLVEILTDGVEWDKENKVLRYTIDKLKPSAGQVIKYSLKAPSEPGKYSFLGARAAYVIRETKKEKTTSDFDLIIPEAEPPTVYAGLKILERIPSEDKEILTVQLKITCQKAPVNDIELHLDHEGFEVLDSEGNEDNGLVYTVDELTPEGEYITKATFETATGDKALSFELNGTYKDKWGLDYTLNKELKISFVTKKPIITIKKALETSTLRFGYSTQIVYTIENTGEAGANVVLKDELPGCVAGDYRWEGKMDPGEKHSMRYTVTPTKAGEFELGEATALYKDRFGNEYTAHTENVVLSVRGIVLEKTLEDSTVKLSLTNTYSEKAFDILIEDYLPRGFEANKELRFNIDRLEAGESKTFSYTLTKRGDVTELPEANVVWKDIYQDSYQAVSNGLSVPAEEEEEEEKEEEKEESPTPTPPKSSKPPAQPGRGFDLGYLKYVLIALISFTLAVLLYYLFSGRKEEIYGIPEGTPAAGTTEGDVWASIESEEKEEPDTKRRVFGRQKRERVEKRLFEIEKPSEETLEMEQLWKMDAVQEKKRKREIYTPKIIKKPSEETDEKKHWKNHIENNELKALKTDLNNLTRKEKEYKEKGNKEMLRQVSDLKRFIREEIKEKEESDEKES